MTREPVILAAIVPDDCFAYTPSLEISAANDYRDVGGRATQEAKADGYRDVGGRATQEAKADGYRDVGGRKRRERVFEELSDERRYLFYHTVWGNPVFENKTIHTNCYGAD